MKKGIVWITLIALTFSSFGFTTTTPLETKTTQAPFVKLNVDSATLTENYFPKQLYHTSKTIAPEQFEFEKSNFATEQWFKLIQSVYVQQTDNNFILTTIAVNGAVTQETILSNDELQSKLKAVSESNATIKGLAGSKPQPQFLDFYDTVYKSNVFTVYSTETAPYAKLSAAKLDETYPDYLNKVSMTFTVYKKGSAFILTNWVYPSLNWESTVYMSLADVEKALNLSMANNQQMLSTIFNQTAVVKPPVPAKVTPPATQVKPPVKAKETIIPKKTYYVIILLKDKTYYQMEFKTQAEASKFMTTSIKKYGKAAVKVFDDKKKLDALIKQLKLTKAKAK